LRFNQCGGADAPDFEGRYAFDFYDHPERLQSPLLRIGGKLEVARC
jgi:predicted molibdopterin-dependent oxidoreductase YjgC